MTTTTGREDKRDDGAGAEPVAAALEREHHEIDRGIEDFVAGVGNSDEPLRAAFAALRRHIYIEEEFLFPPLRKSGMLAPVLVMLSEHRDLWRAMDDLERQVADGVPSGTVRAGCTALLAQLDKHNSKEEPIIYPQVGAVLDEDQRARLQDLIATGRLPDGWACEGL